MIGLGGVVSCPTGAYLNISHFSPSADATYQAVTVGFLHGCLSASDLLPGISYSH